SSSPASRCQKCPKKNGTCSARWAGFRAFPSQLRSLVARHEGEFGLVAAGGIIRDLDGKIALFKGREPLFPTDQLISVDAIGTLIAGGIEGILPEGQLQDRSHAAAIGHIHE